MSKNIVIKGKVIKGDGIGKKNGWPTINLDRRNFAKLKKKPGFGVYSGIVTILGKSYKAGIVIGPIDKKGLPKIEAHIIGFSKNVYGKPAILEIKKFLRKFKKFKIKEDLINQIVKDIKNISSGK